jgi:hypothetical protein
MLRYLMMASKTVNSTSIGECYRAGSKFSFLLSVVLTLLPEPGQDANEVFHNSVLDMSYAEAMMML